MAQELLLMDTNVWPSVNVIVIVTIGLVDREKEDIDMKSSWQEKFDAVQLASKEDLS